MERYIGTKIVLAEPLAKEIGRDGRPDRLLSPNDECSGGQIVPGYKVVYEDGYVSWSPKETFERAYRLVTLAEMMLLGPGSDGGPTGSSIRRPSSPTP